MKKLLPLLFILFACIAAAQTVDFDSSFSCEFANGEQCSLVKVVEAQPTEVYNILGQQVKQNYRQLASGIYFFVYSNGFVKKVILYND